MGLRNIKSALSHVPGIDSLQMQYGPQGSQIFIMGDVKIRLPADATPADIEAALASPGTAALLAVPLSLMPGLSVMSITGATHLADSIKAKIQAAKDRMAQATANTDASLTKLNSAADAADQVSASIAKEADDLMAQIGQFSNGAPA